MSGGWRGVGSSESNALVATSFALLFLSKGRRPVVIAKAKYEDGREWDLHAGGIPNLTRYLEKAWSRELTWQTGDLALRLTAQGPWDLDDLLAIAASVSR